MRECVRIAIVSPVLFYAAINIAFVSPNKSQINKTYWRNAFYHFLKESKAKQNNKIYLGDNLKEIKSNHIKPQFVSKKNIKINNSIAFQDSNASQIKPSTFIINSDTANPFRSAIISEGVGLGEEGFVTDTLDQMSIDSTARLKFFHHNRRDIPYVTLKQNRRSPFFAYPSPGLKTRTVEIDSTGKFVNIIEKTAGEKSKIILTLPLEEYIELSMKQKQREGWEKLGYEYELKDNEKQLSDVIKDITDFEIPLPSVGVLSIFGEPKISLRIGGAVDIHGAWRNETTEGVTASLLGNTRNEPDFEQQVQINVNGTIGDKLNINADWNTERTFEYENQLKIKYTGYEDEIIQSIEAGNVSLQTSPLVGGSEALFGVKANFKLGPLSLTTLASQKKGEIKEVAVSGGSTSQEFSIRAYQYSTNNYFLDTVYSSTIPQLNLFEKYYNNSPSIVDSRYRVVYLEVWKSIRTIGRDPSKERYANAYIDLPSVNFDPEIESGEAYSDSYRQPIQPSPGKSETGRFVLLTPDVDYSLQPETGYLTFKTQINDDDVIAVAYRVEDLPGAENDKFYGEFLKTADQVNQQTGDSTLVLKLVKPSNLQPQYKIAWKLLLKNIYPIGGRNIKKEGFDFNIKYEVEGQEPVAEIGSTKFLQAFGLDQVNANGTATPDNIFDWDPGRTILPDNGEIIFPVLEPFGKNFPEELSDSLKYQDVYDTTVTFAQQKKIKDKWVFTGKYSGEVSSVYQLGFNVVENSVRVLLNGRELSPNVDYVVDYNIGQLTIRNDAALVPGADLKITYEQNDLFSLASKTLLGARGIFDISKKTKLGFSILNLNQQTLSDKVRIGEEPLSNTIYGVDLNTGGDLPFLTNLLDNVISTRQMSTFNLSGEFAYMNPDPNTKKSTIVSDQGKSIAYIDDFEGAKRIIPLGVSHTGWEDISPPANLPLLKDTSFANMMKYKAKSFWFSQTRSGVNVKTIWGDRKQVARENYDVPVMDYIFLPDTAGTYNYNPDLSNRERNWGGIMRALSSTANNLIEENIEYIELWMNAADAPPDGKIYIDLGRISEDVIPNNKLDTEDKPPYNDLLDEGEDVGIDGMTDDQERAFYNSTKADPSGDNFKFTAGTNVTSIFDYFNYNGAQGNGILLDVGRIPDSEDLNRDGSVDLVNSYFRYEIPLDTNRLTNPFIAGGGEGNDPSWYLYRIPLKDTLLKVGDPTFSNVEYIRLFVTGETERVHLRLAEFNLVGNQWQKVLPEDTLMSISVINFEDNPEYYLPPGLNRAKDRTRPDQDILQNEQSLDLVFDRLPDGESREAVKYLYRPLDVFNYEEMKLFIHGDENNFPGSISYIDTINNLGSSEVYFRFGSDTNNYYEYRQPVRPGWNEISIPFGQLTAIKQLRGDSVNAAITLPVQGKPGHSYKVKGQPSLTSVKFLTVGVLNLNNNFNPGPLSGEVWVNELRVVGADDKAGWAYSFAGSVKLADLMTVNFNMSERDPNFHKLSDRFGSRVSSRNWNISTDLDVLKLLPVRLKDSNLKLNYSHSESVGKPKYFPGTDIEVESAASVAQNVPDSLRGGQKTADQIRSETQSVNVSDSWTASSIQLRIPSSYWLIRDTWNALTFGFNYNRSFSRSPTTLSNRSWVWNATVSYALNLSPDYFIYPANIPVVGSIIGLFTDYRNVKVFFTPQTISFNLRASRNKNTNVTRARINTPSQQIISRDFTAQRGFNFAWKITEGGLLNLSTTYNVGINSSLLYLETDHSGRQRPNSEIFGDIFSGQFFGKDYQYQQTFDLRTSPVLPSLWDINRYFTITAGYSVSYQWHNDFRQEILGRSAGFSSRSNIGLTLKLKSLTEPLFMHETDKDEEETESNNTSQVRGRRNFDRIEENQTLDEKENRTEIQDSLLTQDSDSTSTLVKKKKSPLKNALLLLESAAKFIFFDYDNITFNFTNNNSVSKNGILGEGTGLGNFWGFTQNFKNGPSRLFMLGLSSDVGPRAVSGNANLQDVFTEKNNLDFSTSRPLWEGAKVDLNWNVGWSQNKRATLQVDENGDLFVNNITSTGTLTRSFLSIPPVLIFSAFKTGIKQVHELDPEGDNLNDAFVEGFETFPILSRLGFLKDFAKYIPRPNWRLSWDGLEKFALFKGVAKRVSLTSEYKSSYSEGWRLSPDGDKEIQTQRIEYGFSPLASISFTFGEVFGGNLISSVKYSTRTNYDLGTTTKNITETFSRDIGITAGYSKSGFELPLFGLSLKNDIEFSFSYTSTKNSTVIYDMVNFRDAGTPQDGTTRTTIEPRIKYTVSSKVTLSLFYRRSSVEPEGASRIPPTTTNEAGLDVHISIQ